MKRVFPLFCVACLILGYFLWSTQGRDDVSEDLSGVSKESTKGTGRNVPAAANTDRPAQVKPKLAEAESVRPALSDFEPGPGGCRAAAAHYGCLDNRESGGATLENAMERMRDGELSGALALWNLLQYCSRAPRDEDALRLAVLRHVMLSQDTYEAFDDSPLSATRYRHTRVIIGSGGTQDYAQRLRDCKPLQDAIEGGLRERNSGLARSGNAPAQLLFTLWQLPPDASFDDRLLWQVEAQDYAEHSVANNELMGLIAYSHSYGRGIFTARNFSVGAAYAKAASRCGATPDLVPPSYRRVYRNWNQSDLQPGWTDEETVTAWAAELAPDC